MAIPPPHPASPSTPRRRWPWVLLALAVLFVACVAGAALMLGSALEQLPGGLDIRVDGERVLVLPPGEAAVWAVVAGMLVGLLLLVVVPLSLLVALLATVLAVAAALAVVFAVGAVVLSPLWVLALLLWLALRRPRRRPA